MSKKLTKKVQNTTPEPENPPVENSESNTDAGGETADGSPQTAESDPAPETTPDESAESNTNADEPKRNTKKKSVVAQNQCPKCQHVSSEKAIKLGGVNRTQCYIKIDGVAFHNVESQRIMCERCKQIHFVKTYR